MFSKICSFKVATNGYVGALTSHHKTFHHLPNDEAMKLVSDDKALSTYKKTHGYTDQAGECGKCNKQIVEGFSLAKGIGVKFKTHIDKCGQPSKKGNSKKTGAEKILW